MSIHLGRGRPPKIKTCKYCGREFLGRPGRQVCLSCSMQLIKQNNRQLRNKKGPAYEKWKARMKAYLDKHA